MRQNWDNYYRCHNPNVAWKTLLGHIKENIDTMCPLKRFRVAQEKEPWMSNKILEMIKDKDRLLRRAKKRNYDLDWEIAKTTRNRTNFYIRQAKTNYIQDNLNNTQNNVKKFWQNIKEVLPNSKDLKPFLLKMLNF